MAIAQAARLRGRSPNRGFTLIEILVTLAVLTVALGLIVLSLGHDEGARLRQESERLRSALEHAAQLAQWRGTELIWQSDAQGYRFLHPVADGQWEDETDPLLALHPMGAEMRVRAIGPAGGEIAPQLVLRASGRNDPYALVLDSPAGSWTIRGDPLNRVRAAPGQ